MAKFMDNDFILSNETAKKLYHNVAAKLPIIDYHCHIDPREIAENAVCTNITQLWLYGDHYKWRAMRSCGVDEKYITGDASDYEKFKAFASVMPDLIGNPMYHWSHLELRRYFDCELILNEENAEEIWRMTSDKLAEGNMSVLDIIKKSNVEALCTTDDPISDLKYHKQIAENPDITVKVLPAFRPDKGLNCERKGFRAYIDQLAEASGVKITDIESLKEAYKQRLSFFASMGCCTADHGIDTRVLYGETKCKKDIADIFLKAYKNDGDGITADEEAAYKTDLNRFFAKEYREMGWIMQLHFGVLRNVNAVKFKELGVDTGFDVIGADTGIGNLAKLLSAMETDGGIPKTILYSINPSDNEAIGALLGAFQTSYNGMPKIMQGSAWWFNDNESGMREQMTSLANLSALGRFLGMLTDSRSFLSYTRHEYFRRILCDLIGSWVESGRYPDNEATLTKLVENICYYNTKNYFSF